VREVKAPEEFFLLRHGRYAKGGVLQSEGMARVNSARKQRVRGWEGGKGEREREGERERGRERGGEREGEMQESGKDEATSHLRSGPSLDFLCST